MKINKVRTISIKSIIGCIIFLGFGISFIFTNKLFTAGRENWILLHDAKIIGKYDSLKYPHVDVEYTVPNEETRTKRGDVYSSSFYVGQIIDIKYNPNNHDEFTMVVNNTFNIPFIIAGSIIVAISVGLLAIEIGRGTSAKKQLLENNSDLNLNYIPYFMLEYVPLKAENQETYKFKQQIKDFKNYEVTNSKGEVLFYTKRIKKGFTSSATYQLIDSSTKQTTIVNIKKSSSARKTTKGELPVKVNNLPIDKYFETRHITYNISKEGNSTKYTLLNNGSTLGFIYERNGQFKNYEIETAKENIDDLSLFTLCITYR